MPSATSKYTTSERGFTLIELIIASAMMVVLVGVAVTVLVSAMRQQPEVTDRAGDIGTARNALERISVDLRQGEQITGAAPSGMTLATLCDPPDGSGATACTVTYVCAEETGAGTYTCSRSVDGGTPTIVVRGLANQDVFCYESAAAPGCAESATDPTYVGVKVEFPAGTSDQGRTVLEGGAALHNAGLG